MEFVHDQSNFFAGSDSLVEKIKNEYKCPDILINCGVLRPI